jgi:predicted DNA binding protein
MREFVFTLHYGQGADPVMDTFIEAPRARSEAFVCSLDGEQAWRLERVVGPTAALDRIEDRLLAPGGESISGRPCEGERYVDLLDAGPGHRVVYTYLADITGCETVPGLADRYLPGGVLFRLVRQEGEQRWQLLMRDDEKVGLLYDALSAALREGIRFEFGHLDSAGAWAADMLSSLTIAPDQHRVLRTAAEMGYYELPRETTLDEIADRLDLPRSTVSYRLRRAEAQLVEYYRSETL